MKEEPRQHPRRCPRFSGPPETSPSFRAEGSFHDGARPTAIGRRTSGRELRSRVTDSLTGNRVRAVPAGACRHSLGGAGGSRQSAVARRDSPVSSPRPARQVAQERPEVPPRQVPSRPFLESSTSNQPRQPRSARAIGAPSLCEMKEEPRQHPRGCPRFSGPPETSPSFRAEGGGVGRGGVGHVAVAGWGALPWRRGAA